MSKIEIKHPAITEALRKKILCGSFGKNLPPLRTLMREYQVSMQTINKAVKCYGMSNALILVLNQNQSKITGPFEEEREQVFQGSNDKSEQLEK